MIFLLYVNNHVNMDIVVMKAYEIMTTHFNMKPNLANFDPNDPLVKKSIKMSSLEHVQKFF